MNTETGNVSVVNIASDSVLVVNVNTGNLPKDKAQKYMDKQADALRAVFPANKIVVLNVNANLTIVNTTEGY